MTEPHGVTDATRKYVDERLNLLQAEAKRKQWDDPELVLDQWYKYEQIAMHFNDLLMRFRTQALAGLAAVGTLATVLANAKGVALSYLPFVFLVLGVLWVAAWVLDAKYYSLLLKGAVAAIKDFESSAATSGRIGLSTRINNETTDKWSHRVNLFYVIVGLALAAVVVVTWCATRASAS